MVAIWSPETKFRIWFEIEAHACDAQAELGVIPKSAAEAVWKAGDVEFNVARIDEIEREVKHDVIAFLTHLSEHVGPEARFVHQGMTSSDVLDTCFNVQLARASDILLDDMDKLLAALKRRAFEHKDTVCIGRSHGIHAEPPRPMPRWTATGPGWWRRGPRWRPARFRALSAPSPILIQASRPM
jgi:adenylosuccinate lyase